MPVSLCKCLKTKKTRHLSEAGLRALQSRSHHLSLRSGGVTARDVVSIAGPPALSILSRPSVRRQNAAVAGATQRDYCDVPDCPSFVAFLSRMVKILRSRSSASGAGLQSIPASFNWDPSRQDRLRLLGFFVSCISSCPPPLCSFHVAGRGDRPTGGGPIVKTSVTALDVSR